MKHKPCILECFQIAVPRYHRRLAAAVLGAGALTAGASIAGSQSAAAAQRDAANTASGTQLSMFNSAKDTITPYTSAGASLIPKQASFIDPSSSSSPLAALLKLTTPGADMSETLAQTPGFQFQQKYGLKAVDNALAARGLGGSPGAVAKGAANFETGLTNSTWQSVVDKLLATYGLGANTLQNAINTGAGSAASLLGGATATGGQIGSNIIGAGNATAAANNATGAAVGGVGNSFLLSQLLKNSGTGDSSGGGGTFYQGS